MKTLPAFLLLACSFAFASPLFGSMLESITLTDGTVLEDVKVLRVDDSGASVFINGSLRQLAFSEMTPSEKDRLIAKYPAEKPGGSVSGKIRTLGQGERLFAKKGDLNPSVELLDPVIFREIERSEKWVRVSVELWINEDYHSAIVNKPYVPAAILPPSPRRPEPWKKIILEEWNWRQSSSYIIIDGVIKNETGSAVGKVEMHYEIYDGDTFLNSGSTYANKDAIGVNQTSPIKIMERYEGRPLSKLRIKYSFEY